MCISMQCTCVLIYASITVSYVMYMGWFDSGVGLHQEGASVAASALGDVFNLAVYTVMRLVST